MSGKFRPHKSQKQVEIIDLLDQDESGEELELPTEGNDILDEEDDSASNASNLSVYEDALTAMDNEGLGDADATVDACTPEESQNYRRRLRRIGKENFLEETVRAETITAKKLCTAFGIRLPAFLEGAPDESYYPLLSLCISREFKKREKLRQYNSVDDAVSLLKKSKNIIVLTGAGVISTSLGIPDFRSKETGLYSKLQHLGLNDPQEVFDIGLFRDDPQIFYSVAKDILPAGNKYSPTHAFIRLLQEKGKLLTNFTQNIDNLEGHAGIRPEKLIQCHGSFATASCLECKYKVNGEEIFKDMKLGRVARCDQCIRHLRQLRPGGLKRKRNSSGASRSKRNRNDYEDSTDSEDYDIMTAGVMKPDITFFGEGLPQTFHDRLIKHDRNLVDLVLVIGTSLKVAPVSEIPAFLPRNTPQLYISREHCRHENFDIDLLGDCDVVVAELCRRAGWDLRHEMIPLGRKIDVQLREGETSRYSFKVITK